MVFTTEEQLRLRRSFSVVVSDSPPPPDLDSLPTSDMPYVAPTPDRSRWHSAAVLAGAVLVLAVVVSVALLVGSAPSPDVVGTTPSTAVPTTQAPTLPDTVVTVPADPPDSVAAMVEDGEDLLTWGLVADSPFALVGMRQEGASCVQVRPGEDNEWCGPIDGPDLLRVESAWTGERAVVIVLAAPGVDHVRLDTPSGSTVIAIHGDDSGYPPTGLLATDEPSLMGTLTPISSNGELLSEPMPILVRGLDQAPSPTHPSETMVEAVNATDGATYLGGDTPGITSAELLFSLGGHTYEVFAVPTGTNVAYLRLADQSETTETDGVRIDVYQSDDSIEAVFDRIGLTVRVGSTTSSRAELLTTVGRVMTSMDEVNG